jgi:catechol-2,3-dioxygenase
MSELAEGNAMLRPTLHHVNLKTTRLPEMMTWYARVLGMRLLFQFAGGAFLTNDAANHRLALLTTPRVREDPDKVAHAGFHHSAFEYATLDELLATYTRLKGLGILPHFTVDHGVTTSFYYLDPDGNSVELQVDNFGDWAQSTEWLCTSPQFAANPLGTPVDPEQLRAARAAGASVADLHHRAYAGAFPPAGPMDLRIPGFPGAGV